jgi:ABC-2 type transport system permease protein
MSLNRIKAVLLQEIFITKHSLEVIMDLFFFSIMSIIVFGFVSTFLASTINPTVAHYLLLGMLLWEIVRITQYSMSVGSLWNIWSRNLSNMFITPLSIQEYLIAHMLSGVLKAVFIFTAVALLAIPVFHFNVFAVGGWNLLLFFINLTLFSWSTGIAILGFIFRYGTRIQALAWGLVYIFQPLTAALFPLHVLHPSLQAIAYWLPPTHVFEAARANLTDPAIKWHLMGVALLENAVYFILALWVFLFLFQRSKETGQFARNEG